jgi:hypothetical protein
VAKLVTVWRKDEIEKQAKHYVRSYILLPSGMLGLVCMLAGLGGLGYQLVASGSYSWATFLASSDHRYILKTVPEVFAARMRTAVGKSAKKARKIDQQPTEISHPGRGFVPLGYVAGVLVLFAASAAALSKGSVDPVPAVLMPWAGFYWGKLFLWRGVIQ